MKKSPISDVKRFIPCPKEYENWKSKKPLQVALYIIDTVAKMGYQGMKAYTFRSEPIEYLCGDFEETFMTESTICFKVYSYFCFWLGIDDKFSRDMPGSLIFEGTSSGNMLSVETLNSLQDGLYRCEMAGNEDHQFLWLIHEGRLYYAGGYGGVYGPVFLTFDKNTYFKRYVKAMLDSDKDSYKYVYGINKVYGVGGFSCLIVVKNSDYVQVC